MTRFPSHTAARLWSQWESKRDACGVRIHTGARATAVAPVPGAETNGLGPQATRLPEDDSAGVGGLRTFWRSWN